MHPIEPPDLNDDRWLEATVAMEAASEAEDWTGFLAALESIRTRFVDLPAPRLEKALSVYALDVAIDWRLPSDEFLPLVSRVVLLPLSPVQWIHLAAKFHRWLSGRSISDEEIVVQQRLMDEAKRQRGALQGLEAREADAILGAAGLQI